MKLIGDYATDSHEELDTITTNKSDIALHHTATSHHIIAAGSLENHWLEILFRFRLTFNAV